ncbi:MAG: hypothetical protein CL676_00650 [Bdellovibrionaceae bacterium]|nr:hypothetical protein [Pseudobdellovibrionaceae bacterium]|tara:strand:+ start:2237 stop:3286 length:1050 start_codon:yes stop_codon:yes gene_type:complete
MKNFFQKLNALVLIGSLFAQATWAQTILLFPPETPEHEIQAALMSQPETLRLEEWTFLHPTSLLESNDLIQKFSVAEKKFLDGAGKDELLLSYQEVLSLQSKANWGKQELKLILTAHLRTVQLTDNSLPSSFRESHLQQAAFLSEYTQPIENSIPPPLIREMNELKATLKWRTYTPPQKIITDFPKVFFAGQVRNTSLGFRVPQELNSTVRLTFASSKFHPRTIEVTPDQIENLKISPTAVVSGDCKSFRSSLGSINAEENKDFEIYQPLSCQSKNLQLTQQPKKDAFKESFPPMEIPSNKSHWKMEKKHWIWLGVGAVATAILISQMRKKDETAPPPASTVGGDSQGF